MKTTLIGHLARLELHCRRILDTRYDTTDQVLSDMTLLNVLITGVPAEPDDNATGYPALCEFVVKIAELSQRAAKHGHSEGARLSAAVTPDPVTPKPPVPRYLN